MEQGGNLRSSKDNITGQQRSALTQERDGLLDAKDHIGRVAVLHNLAVQLGGDAQRLRVLDQVGANDGRPKGRPAVVALAERPLAAAALELPVAVRDVVADGVAEHVVERLGLGHVTARLADHRHELALVVQRAVLRDGVHGDRVCRTRERGDGLVEQDGVFRNWQVGLRGGTSALRISQPVKASGRWRTSFAWRA